MRQRDIPPRPAELSRVADRLRFEVTRMIARARSCHVGSCLSVMDILVALYGGVMNCGSDPDNRDRMILSKGHAAAALYAVLAEYGYFPAAKLEDYLQDGSPFIAHTNTFGIPGVRVLDRVARSWSRRGERHRAGRKDARPVAPGVRCPLRRGLSGRLDLGGGDVRRSSPTVVAGVHRRS